MSVLLHKLRNYVESNNKWLRKLKQHNENENEWGRKRVQKLKVRISNEIKKYHSDENPHNTTFEGIFNYSPSINPKFIPKNNHR